MKLLQKKLKSKKGFTLIEMLVVIAIIAILVAISIPMVSGALEKARVAADDANLQAAKSVALLAEMEGKIDESTNITDRMYYYNIETGKLSTGTPAASNKGQSSVHKNEYIVVTFDGGKMVSLPDWGSYTGS